MSTNVLRAPAGIIRLRPKNQLTVPDGALAAIGATVGTRFVVIVEDGAIHLEPVLASYAGTLSDIEGADWANEVRQERDAWGS